MKPDMYVADGDYIQDIEVNDLRNRYLLTKGSTQEMVNNPHSICSAGFVSLTPGTTTQVMMLSWLRVCNCSPFLALTNLVFI